MIPLLLLACAAAPAPEPEPEPAPEPVAEPKPPPKIVNGKVFDSRLSGICDGSAAIRLPSRGLLVAYDEDTSLHVFDWQGRPKGSRDLHPELGGKGEYDLEGAAVVGDVAYWIGSHGLDGDNEDAPARRMLFSTNLPSDSLGDLEVGKPVDLLPILRKHPDLAPILTDEAMKRGSKEGGLNIEALAAHPDGGLVVGLRGPLSGKLGVEGNALVVHLSEPSTIASVHQVDLGGRGLRDMALHEDRWLAIAGPVGKGEDFALYWIDADYQTRPAGDPSWTDGLRPEGLIRNDNGWLLLSDDGKLDRDDPTAKDGRRKCDKIRKEHGATHQQVYARIRTIPMPD